MFASSVRVNDDCGSRPPTAYRNAMDTVLLFVRQVYSRINLPPLVRFAVKELVVWKFERNNHYEWRKLSGVPMIEEDDFYEIPCGFNGGVGSPLQYARVLLHSTVYCRPETRLQDHYATTWAVVGVMFTICNKEVVSSYGSRVKDWYETLHSLLSILDIPEAGLLTVVVMCSELHVLCHKIDLWNRLQCCTCTQRVDKHRVILSRLERLWCCSTRYRRCSMHQNATSISFVTIQHRAQYTS